MDTIQLGKKIKEARLARKMTQAEVVGDFITRNMLSQIESGTATPSVRTLEYLAKVLDIPIQQLVPNDSSDALSQLTKAKNALASHDYEKAIKLSREHPPELSDEFCAILSRACLGQARNMADKNEYQKAAEFARMSIDCADQGIYYNESLRAEGMLLLSSVAEKLSEYYSELFKERI